MATRYVYLATGEFNEYIERTYGLTRDESVALWDAIRSSAAGYEDPEGDLLTEEIGEQKLTFRYEWAFDNNSCVVRIATEIPGPNDEYINEKAAKQRRTR